MVTQSQKDMLKDYLFIRIGLIKRHCAEHNLTLNDAVKFINDSIKNQLNEKEYLLIQPSNKVALYKGIHAIKMELSGIFNPNFVVLDRLKIINNIRDKEEKVSPELTDQSKAEFKSAAIEIFSHLIDKDKELLPYKEKIDILKDYCDSQIVDKVEDKKSANLHR